MNETLIEHPIIFIEKLLKLGLGDKGRLLYLKNSIKDGKPIYDSDKNFLNSMQFELDNIKSAQYDKSLDTINSDNSSFNQNSISEYGKDIFKSNENHSSVKNTSSSELDSGIQKIQNLMGQLEKSNSRLKDNLELILISRDNSSLPQIENLNSIETISNLTKSKTSNLLSSFKNNSNSKNLQIFKIKKHDVMAYTSAGLFTLWYASFQNMIDLGPLQGVSLGLSAFAAISAGIFYKKQKTA